MILSIVDPYEADVPEQAVQALGEAYRRALQAGHPLVLVQNGQLIRISNGTRTVLKQLPARQKVTVRTKIAAP